MKRAVGVLSGELLGDREFYKNLISRADVLYSADGGANHLLEIGEKPDFILKAMVWRGPYASTAVKEEDIRKVW